MGPLGCPQSVTMKISGHKAASMFRRYDIANESDLRAALESVQRYHEAQTEKVVTIASNFPRRISPDKQGLSECGNNPYLKQKCLDAQRVPLTASGIRTRFGSNKRRNIVPLHPGPDTHPIRPFFISKVLHTRTGFRLINRDYRNVA